MEYDLWIECIECDSTWSHDIQRYYIWFDIAIDVDDTKLDCLLFTWISIWIFSKVFKSSLHHLMQCAWIFVHLSPWFNPYYNKITFLFPKNKKDLSIIDMCVLYVDFMILATCGRFFFHRLVFFEITLIYHEKMTTK